MMILRYISHDPNKKMLIETNSPKIQLRISRHCWGIHSLIIDESENEIKSNYYTNFLQSRLDLLKSNVVTETINDTVLFLHHPHNQNYSHFTIQCMSGFLLAQDAGIISKKLKIAVDQSVSFQRDICYLYGIKSEQIINLNANVLYKFNEVIYCNSIFYATLDDKTYSLYENIGHKFQANLDIKLYVTRGRNTIRSTINEDEIIDLMKKKGFLIVDFALIPVHVQIALIQNASIICAAHGASGANLVYKDKTRFKFIEYFSPMWPAECHARILNIKNCDYSPVMGSALSHHQQSSIKVDLNLINRAFDRTIYSFSCEDDELSGCETAKNDLHEKMNVLKNIADNNNIATRYMRKGNYKKFIEYKDYNFIYFFDTYSLARYYESCFLQGDKHKFLKLTLQICKTRSIDFNVILDFCLKAGLFGLFKYITQKYNLKNQSAINNLTKLYDNIISFPDSSILTYHNTLLGVDLEKMKLIHSLTIDHPIVLKYAVKNTGLYIPSNDKYIDYIDEHANIIISSHFSPCKIVKHNCWSVSIKNNHDFLSAIPDGSVDSSRYSRQWESFFVIRNKKNNLIQ